MGRNDIPDMIVTALRTVKRCFSSFSYVVKCPENVLDEHVKRQQAAYVYVCMPDGKKNGICLTAHGHMVIRRETGAYPEKVGTAGGWSPTPFDEVAIEAARERSLVQGCAQHNHDILTDMVAANRSLQSSRID